MTLKDTFPPLFCHLRYNKHKSDISPLNISDIDTYPFLLVYPSTSFWQALDYNSKFGCLIHWKKFVCVRQKFLFFRFLTLLYDFYLELEYSFLLLNYYVSHEKYNDKTFIIRVARILDVIFVEYHTWIYLISFALNVFKHFFIIDIRFRIDIFSKK